MINSEGLLTRYDLAPSVTHKEAAVAEPVLAMNVQFDALWGITGGTHAVIRVLEEEAEGQCIMAFVDLARGDVHEVADIASDAWVDPETGHILQTARGGAILELDRHGNEAVLLRAMPAGEWVCLEPGRVSEHSTGFKP